MSTTHVTFGYEHARPTKTASDVHIERAGVCRDFAHLAVTFCRCMNIPARYCTGYLGDIGVPPDPAPMDFSAWFEAYLGGRWYAFDARHNMPRIGRILIGRGRDASDVAISNSFGHTTLAGFKVWTDEIVRPAPSAPLFAWRNIPSSARNSSPSSPACSVAAARMPHGERTWSAGDRLEARDRIGSPQESSSATPARSLPGQLEVRRDVAVMRERRRPCRAFGRPVIRHGLPSSQAS